MKSIPKAFFCLLCAILLIPAPLKAEKVSVEQAALAAQNWFRHIRQYEAASFIITNIDSINLDQEAVIYRFSLDDGQFIWVSADDRHAPILAYNLEPSDIPSVLPDASRDFLDQYAMEISRTRVENLKSGGQHPGWSNILQGKFKSSMPDDEVFPMMQVTWGQSGGYREFTPGNTPTGCVAVAMVQVMRHWEYPDSGQGFREYTHPTYGYFAVDFDTVALIWDEMPLNEPNSRIARLMLYAGIALEMDYNPEGSGTQTDKIPDILAGNFFYNNHRLVSTGVSTFGRIEYWINMLKNELINGRPLIMRGQGTGGHAFNFDGFKGDHFHVNWGWSGSQNGYFLVTSLTPGSHNFSESQGAIAGIFPGDTMMIDRPYNPRLIAGDSRVILAWNGLPHKGFEHYNIYRDNILAGQTKEKSYVDEGAENGQVYNYYIKAYYTIDSLNYESEPSPELTSPVVAGLNMPYLENFEEGHPGWTIKTGKQGFNWGTAKDLGMGSADSSHFIGINSGTAGSNTLVSDYLVSNQIDLSQTPLAILSFDYVLRQWQDIDHLYLMYRVFEDGEWITFHELETTRSYTNWTNYKCYLPAEAMEKHVQLAFYYTDNGQIGYGAGIDNISIKPIDNPGKPDFKVSAAEACVGQEVVFTDNSTGTRDSYSWDFGPGAEPRYAQTAGPHTVVYSSSGIKDVKLVLNGLDEKRETGFMEILRPPEARFSMSVNYKTVTFNNTSTNADAFMWDFGDGIKVTQKNPIHVYQLSGDYLIKLTAIGFVCGNDTLEKWLKITITGFENEEIKPEFKIFPNPGDGRIKLQLSSAGQDNAIISLSTLTGLEIFREELILNHYDILVERDFSHLGPGVYFISIKTGDACLTEKLLIN